MSLDELHAQSGNEPADGGPRPEGRLEQEELAIQVRAGLAALSEEHRTIMLLREVEGLDYETIAEILELPVGTVRSRLHRARLQLRDHLKQVMQEDQS